MVVREFHWDEVFIPGFIQTREVVSDGLDDGLVSVLREALGFRVVGCAERLLGSAEAEELCEEQAGELGSPVCPQHLR